MKTRVLFLTFVFGMALARAEAMLGWTEEFDNVAHPRWLTIPKSAQIVPKDTLSAANRVVKIAPEKGEAWLLSSDKFVRGDVEICFAAKPPEEGKSLFYYIGFHETEPWLKSVCWIQIQDTAVSFGVKTPEGGKTFKHIGFTNGDYQTLKISQSGDKLKVSFDGNEHVFEEKDLLSTEPMPVFIGANSYSCPAELKVDYVKVSGGKAKERFTPIELTGNAAAVAAKVNNRLTTSSWNTEFNLLLQGGLHWGQIAIQGENTRTNNFFSPVFAMRIDNRMVFSHEFELKKATRAENGYEIELYDAKSKVTALLTGRSVPGDRLLLQLKLTNNGDETQIVQPIFPIMGGIMPGNNLDKVKYFFPWRGGVLGDKTATFRAEYNGFAWMQLQFAYSEEANCGIAFFPEDANGRFKGLVMQKGKDGNAPEVKHSEIVIYKEQPSLDLLETQSGVAFAQYYRGEHLKKGESVQTPEVRVFAFRGDWKKPLEQYSCWMKERMKPVDVPKWFRDSYTWMNAHPQAFYDEAKKEYILHRRLAGGENAIQIAFWDDYPLPFESRRKYHSLAQTMPGDFIPNKERGGVPALAAEVAKCHEKGSAFTLYIDHRFCYHGLPLAKKYGELWATKDAEGNYPGYVSSDDKYLMCFYDLDKWVEHMAKRCKSLVADLKLDGIYQDELAVNFQCYNEQHDHYKAGNYPTDPQGVAKAITKVRNAMQEANPNAILMTEHAGSDYLTQFFDGSWDQTFYNGAFAFVEKHYDDLRLNFFRFYFPHFKLSEWGTSERHPWRCLFNGIGMDMGGFPDTDIQRQFAQIMKENGDAFASDALEPIVPTSDRKFLANRFPKTYKVIHTIYNTSDKKMTAAVLEGFPPNREWHFVELIRDENVNTNANGFPELTVDADRTAVLACFPKILSASRKGNECSVRFDKKEGDRIVVCENFDDEHFLPPRGKWTSIKAADGAASYKVRQSGKIIIKLFRGDYLVDEIVM